MSDPETSASGLFLERETYRRRRLIDAVKLLPILGGVAFCLPLLWTGTGLTSRALLYLFTAWGGLIVLTAFLSRRVTRPDGGDRTTQLDPARDRG